MTSEPLPPRKPAGSSWIGYIIVGLVAGGFSGIVSATVCLAAVFILSGNVRKHSGAPESEPVVEQGTAEVTIVAGTGKGETEVFYRRPFLYPPQLTVNNGSTCFILEQKADSFKLGRNVGGSSSYVTSVSVEWKAEGVPR